MAPDFVSTRSVPRRTTVYSSNSGVCLGSVQPAGLSMRAMLTASVAELTRPTYSAIRFGRLPAAATIVGFSIRSGMDMLNIVQWRNGGQPHGTDSFCLPQPGQCAAAQPGGGAFAGAGDRRQYGHL